MPVHGNGGEKVMRIIFLDIDGVLNTERARVKLRDINQCDNWDYNNIFCQKSLENLAKIRHETKAHIVLHSSRRFDLSSHSLDIPLKIQFMMYGLHPYYIDNTPALTGNKEEEIKAWLISREVSSFVILDDEAVFKDLASNWISCNPHYGITNEVRDLSIELLNRKGKNAT